MQPLSIPLPLRTMATVTHWRRIFFRSVISDMSSANCAVFFFARKVKMQHM